MNSLEIIEDLEHVDEKFLRNIFGDVHVKTPLEVLYLETGCVPIRYLPKSRRLNFLHYILSDKEDSLLSNIYFEYLKNLQQTHSKARPLQFETFKLQEYLRSDSKYH